MPQPQLLRSVFSLLAVLLLLGCGSDNRNGSVPVRSLDSLAGRWVVANAYALPAPLVADAPIVLTVAAGGEVQLATGCNTASGHARVRDSRLMVREMSVTEMACPPEPMAQERWLLQMLQAEPRLERSGPYLAMHWAADGRDYSLGLALADGVTDAPPPSADPPAPDPAPTDPAAPGSARPSR